MVARGLQAEVGRVGTQGPGGKGGRSVEPSETGRDLNTCTPRAGRPDGWGRDPESPREERTWGPGPEGCALGGEGAAGAVRDTVAAEKAEETRARGAARFRNLSLCGTERDHRGIAGRNLEFRTQEVRRGKSKHREYKAKQA